MKIKKYLAYNINYDTDGNNIDDLPKSMIISAENLEEALMTGADQISDKTGWCVNSFLIKKNPVKETTNE
jgi:hypothetical protein